MKTEIKRTPITFNGEDRFEVLFEDSEIWQGDACQYCMYEEWNGMAETLASCDIVHGCGFGRPTYFKLI